LGVQGGVRGCYICYICYAGGFMFNSAELNMIDAVRVVLG